MSQVKKWALIILLFIFSFCFFGCQESSESKYSRAQKLLTESKYDEAIKIFDEISTYEDSSKMSMYTKAIAVAESGDYETAINTFSVLGDYKDCPMMIIYYSARQIESQISEDLLTFGINAAEKYDSISLFLDSKERAESCRLAIYEEAVRLAEDEKYPDSIEMIKALKDFQDCPQLSEYYNAFRLEQNGQYSEASTTFRALDDYKDSKEQSLAVLSRGYEKADQLEKDGEQEKAFGIFVNLGTYIDSYERAYSPYYNLGIKKRETKEWDNAVIAFKKAGNYSDASEQVFATRYSEGIDKREKGDYEGAVIAFEKAGDYSDASEQVSATRYSEGIDKREKGDYEGAVIAFEKAGDYSDASEQVFVTRYSEGIDKREKGDYEGAIIAFEHAGNYITDEDIPRTKYLQANELVKEENYEKAMAIYLTIHNYKDVTELIASIECHFRNGYVNADSVDFLKNPYRQSDIISVLKRNDHFSILGEAESDGEKWLHICYGYIDGYVNATYIQAASSVDITDESITIAIPNDTTNEGRALLLLQAQGLIKLKADAGITATVADIEENKLGLKFNEVEAAMVPNVLADSDYAVINGNYALAAGLDKALLYENSESPYVNVVCVNEANKDSDLAKALAAAVQSQQVVDYFAETYKDGSAIAMIDNPTDGYDASVDYEALKGQTIEIACTLDPHSFVLEKAKATLAEKEINLKIIVVDDYITPNTMVDAGDVFANYFAHQPYQDNFNAENGTKIVTIAKVHVEPMGLYAGKQADLSALDLK